MTFTQVEELSEFAQSHQKETQTTHLFATKNCMNLSRQNMSYSTFQNSTPENRQGVFYSLKLTAQVRTWKKRPFKTKKRNDRIPRIHFQVLWLLVSVGRFFRTFLDLFGPLKWPPRTSILHEPNNSVGVTQGNTILPPWKLPPNNHLGCIKNPVNNGIKYLSTGAFIFF